MCQNQAVEFRAIQEADRLAQVRAQQAADKTRQLALNKERAREHLLQIQLILARRSYV